MELETDIIEAFYPKTVSGLICRLPFNRSVACMYVAGVVQIQVNGINGVFSLKLSQEASYALQVQLNQLLPAQSLITRFSFFKDIWHTFWKGEEE